MLLAFCFQTNLMTLYLEAVNYKVVTALATLEGHPPAAASNTFSQHIETTRDKNGLQMSVLKVRTTRKQNGHCESIHTEISSRGYGYVTPTYTYKSCCLRLIKMDVNRYSDVTSYYI